MTNGENTGPALDAAGGQILKAPPRWRRWWRRAAVVVIIAAGVGLVLMQKHDLMINDTGWLVDEPRMWRMKCADGTEGVFIGTAIKIEGCDITAAGPGGGPNK